MSHPEVISETAVDMYEVKQALKAVEKETEELGFRSQKTMEYLNEVAKLSLKDAKELRDGIAALEIPRLKEDHIAKIVDVLPVDLNDLKQLVSSFNITVKDDSLKQIVELLPKK